MKLIVTLFIVTLAITACAESEDPRTETSDTLTDVTDAPAETDDEAGTDRHPDEDTTDEPVREPELAVDDDAYEARERFQPNLLTTQEFTARIARSGPYSVHMSGEETIDGETTTYEKRWHARGDDFVYESGTTRFIRLGDRSFVCIDAEGWTCSEGSYALYTHIEHDIREDPSAYPVKKLGVRVIAGTNADCYLVLHDEGDATLCLTETGAPLSVEINSADLESSFTATNYSEEPRSGVFTLPGPVE